MAGSRRSCPSRPCPPAPGWAVMLVASIRPDLFGPIIIPGSPLSYWAGIEGQNPMRYTGGLTGGSWVTLDTQAAGGLALLVDPAAQAIGDRRLLPFGDHPGRGAEALDGDDPADVLGIEARVAQGDVAAERMGDDCYRGQAKLVNQLGQIVNEGRGFIIAVGCPLRIAMPAQVRGDNVPVMP